VLEVRDVSLADAPSVLMADSVHESVAVGPGTRLPFHMRLPEAAPSASWALRAQVDVHGAGRSTGAVYLTTAHWPVAPVGDCELGDVAVQRV
jgi:putative lipoprotein